ncbi:hypothetical protein LTR94_026285, partial [Friedmanniomyces endolithicus]
AQSDNGALLIVAPTERRVRIEVGYGLEPILTDAFSSQLIRSKILPAFQEGDFQTGITQGVDALISQLELDPGEAAARAAAIEEQSSQDGSLAPIILGGIIFLAVIFVVLGASGRGRRYRSGDVGPVLIWAAAEALKGARGGGSFGGGGFRGGGGGFGGGGASGGW